MHHNQKHPEMKKLAVLFILSAATVLISACSHEKIKVGVFRGDGGAATCIRETMAALSVDSGIEAMIITSSDISGGILDGLDAIVIPGGGGTRQYLNLGEANRNRIKEFIGKGGGAVGICAGAYLFSETPGYASMSLNGAKAIDIEHDNRGHGMAKFTLNGEGRKIFPELADKDTCFVIYYEGPVFVKNESSEIQYDTFAIMESDVHEEGNAPSGMTDGKPFFIGNDYGKGRVFSSIAHPEATPGMIWMIPRMVRWTLKAELKKYPENITRPAVEPYEILMSQEDLRYEASLYKVFLYGKEQEKLLALDWLQAHYSWDAKNWLQGLLYDASPKVRARAAQYLASTHYLPFLEDVRAAYSNENDTDARKSIGKSLDILEKLKSK